MRASRLGPPRPDVQPKDSSVCYHSLLSRIICLLSRHIHISSITRYILVSCLALAMAVSSSSDVFILLLGVVLAALYLFRDQLFAVAKPKAVSLPSKLNDGDGNPRDFVAKMKQGVRELVISILYYYY